MAFSSERKQERLHDYTLAEVLQNEKVFSKIQSNNLSVNPLPGGVKVGRCATGE